MRCIRRAMTPSASDPTRRKQKIVRMRNANNLEAVKDLTSNQSSSNLDFDGLSMVLLSNTLTTEKVSHLISDSNFSRRQHLVTLTPKNLMSIFFSPVYTIKETICDLWTRFYEKEICPLRISTCAGGVLAHHGAEDSVQDVVQEHSRCHWKNAH